LSQFPYFFSSISPADPRRKLESDAAKTESTPLAIKAPHIPARKSPVPQ